jgi:hypothetical protein
MIKNKINAVGVSFLALAMITACNAPIQQALTGKPAEIQQAVNPVPDMKNSKVISGRALFPEANINTETNSGNNKFEVKASPSTLVNKATISLIDPATNVTLATGLTDGSGNFTINTDSAFNPTLASIYTLEAIKRQNTLAKRDLMALRTFIRKTATGWESITGTGIFLNDKTTSLTIISALNTSPAVTPASTIDAIDVDTPQTTFTFIPFGVITSEVFNRVNALVGAILGVDADPLKNISFSSGAYILTGPSSISVSGIPGLRKVIYSGLNTLEGNSREIFTDDLDFNSVTKIFDNPGTSGSTNNNDVLGLTPDTNKVLFGTNTAGNSTTTSLTNLRIIDGTTVTLLTDKLGGTFSNVGNFKLTRDRLYILFKATVGGIANIYKVGSDFTGTVTPVNLTDNMAGTSNDAAFSDNSSLPSNNGKFLFTKTCTSGCTGSQLYVGNLDDSGTFNLTTTLGLTGTAPTNYSISDNGAKVAFTYGSTSYFVNSDASGILQAILTPTGYTNMQYASMALSPDGTKLAIKGTSTTVATAPNLTREDIFLYNTSTGTPTSLTGGISTSLGSPVGYGNFDINYFYNTHINAPVFTPDSNKILFTHRASRNDFITYKTNISIINAALNASKIGSPVNLGTTPLNLNSSLTGGSPILSPDGLKIIFYTYNDTANSTYNLHRVDITSASTNYVALTYDAFMKPERAAFLIN